MNSFIAQLPTPSRWKPIAIGAAIVTLFLGVIYSPKLYRMWEISIVEDACADYARATVGGAFKVMGAPDTDENGKPGYGYGTCGIYNPSGMRLDIVECDVDYFMNTGCKAAKVGVFNNTAQ